MDDTQSIVEFNYLEIIAGFADAIGDGDCVAGWGCDVARRSCS